MPQSRRQFLKKTTTLSAIATTTPAFASSSAAAAACPTPKQKSAITRRTLAEAEQLVGIPFTNAERNQILNTIDQQRELLLARASEGPLPNTLAPATVFRAQLPDKPLNLATPNGDPATNLPDAGACPTSEIELAYAPVWKLSAWLKARKVTSKALTELAIKRLKNADKQLHCVITMTQALARQQAAQADAELDAGAWRGPLHGVPWGAKDIIDTADFPTTWGAEPFQNRVPTTNAAVVDLLANAGAVLVAKLAVGALAYGDIWFGGTCRNPFNPEEGSSGSSAGSASAVAAGLVPFALGTETYGSIISPCARCGATGLRPTFGRVARNGVMALCWSLDKIGPITRSVLDTAIVLNAINGADPLDPSSVEEPLHFDPAQSARGLRLGYEKNWFASDAGDSAALDAARAAGMELVPITLPKINAQPLLLPLFAEAAASFEELTRSGKDDSLTWQADEAWPNTFRQSWFLPAPALIQAERLRRRAMRTMHEIMNDQGIDAIIAPPFAGELVLLTNATGQPTLILRSGIDNNGQPQSVTLVGRLFDEGTLCRAGAALETRLKVAAVRPKGFA